MTLHIIAGGLRGRALKLAKEGTRPTASRLREAMFNILTHHRMLGRIGHPGLEGSRLADICAGSGALGLEAISRGVAWVSFVDHARSACQIIQENATKLGVGSQLEVLNAQATQLPRTSTPYDTILIDPPYGKGLAEPILASLTAAGWLAPHSAVMVETGNHETITPPENLHIADMRRYGASQLWLLVDARHGRLTA